MIECNPESWEGSFPEDKETAELRMSGRQEEVKGTPPQQFTEYIEYLLERVVLVWQDSVNRTSDQMPRNAAHSPNTAAGKPQWDIRTTGGGGNGFRPLPAFQTFKAVTLNYISSH